MRFCLFLSLPPFQPLKILAGHAHDHNYYCHCSKPHRLDPFDTRAERLMHAAPNFLKGTCSTQSCCISEIFPRRPLYLQLAVFFLLPPPPPLHCIACMMSGLHRRLLARSSVDGRAEPWPFHRTFRMQRANRRDSDDATIFPLIP
uniref:Uncharacterized protein n=1 Tax=Hordeum vulgare subsp. vulgare TaxID=112509 RepID=A0A8I6XJR3_HORVV